MRNTDETFRRNATIGCRASSIISVALTLFLVDLLLSAVAITRGTDDNMRGQVGLVVKLYRDASPADISETQAAIKALPGIRDVSHTTADVVLEEEKVFNPELLSLMGYNPFSDEFEVFLKPEYTYSDSIDIATKKMAALPNVEDVYMQPELIDNMNELLARIKIYLSIFVFVLMVISFALIFNTMKLAVYSRRFTIYNMRIVGATRYFILKPYLISGLITGVISTVAAYLIFLCLVWYTSKFDYDIFFTVTDFQYVMIFIISLVIGVVQCVGTSYYAVTKYFESSYDKLFR